ncbi:hypothetical protein FOMPIDRAFT_117668 [Fomitopsis schrenkii]|uniref:Ndc10 domain-containing protein n=1 Tax=Fomitopsis schrenkii TaxID=2126942 RepID=S8DXJ8_FOMSC|nr:hypothetical protein FOMPIDRAFT_117668 [Fomitopsis schrenkii]
MAWIMNKADNLDLYSAEKKDFSIPCVKYGTAQKMRAAINHIFGRDFGFGDQTWGKKADGKFVGNPSLSKELSQYMISLQRCKVYAGDEVTSARAITHKTMRQLWLHNVAYKDPEDDNGSSMKRKRKQEHPEDWTGSRIRRTLQLLYTVAMLCLLHFDEALWIRWTDVHFSTVNDVPCVRLSLPFLKTAQNGGIAPFFLYPNNEREWLCPVRAFETWWRLSHSMSVNMSGYVFRKHVGRDGVSGHKDDGMSYDGFVERFWNNLVDIDIDPRPYSGCQYLAVVKHWPFRNICTWGGWAEHFDNPGTIFKYLMSWVDTPLVERKDYFNPKRAASNLCSQCGRTCICA